MENKEILSKGYKIKFPTGWVWDVEDNNVIRYSPTGQTSSLLNYSKRDYVVISEDK